MFMKVNELYTVPFENRIDLSLIGSYFQNMH